jgi:hypothetical protein
LSLAIRVWDYAHFRPHLSEPPPALAPFAAARTTEREGGREGGREGERERERTGEGGREGGRERERALHGTHKVHEGFSTTNKRQKKLLACSLPPSRPPLCHSLSHNALSHSLSRRRYIRGGVKEGRHLALKGRNFQKSAP